MIEIQIIYIYEVAENGKKFTLNQNCLLILNIYRSYVHIWLNGVI